MQLCVSDFQPVLLLIGERLRAGCRFPFGISMSFVLQPWQLLLAILAGGITETQRKRNEYIQTENKILKEAFSQQRIVLTNDQRRRLAEKGKAFCRKVLFRLR